MSNQLQKQIEAAKAAAKSRNITDLKTDFRKFVGDAHPSCVRVWVNEVTDDAVLLGSADSKVKPEERKTFQVDRAVFPAEVNKKQLWEICIQTADYSASRKYLTGKVDVLQRVKNEGFSAADLLAD